MANCTVYVDADNQAAALAPGLLHALASRGLTAATIELFGNCKAPQLGHWRRALVDHAQGVMVRCTRVPCHSQAADAALLLAVGARLGEHLQTATLIVIMSRDNLMLATAQRLQDLGARVLVCHGPAAPAKCNVDTVLLPAPGASREALSLVGKIRRELPAEQNGGYRKSLVGALLRRAGLDRRGRAVFLTSLPGLRSERTTGDRLLFI
jgi:hypothetical protein